MNEDAKREQWRRQVVDEAEHLGLQQLSLIYGGLIVIGAYMVTPFLTASSLDLSARICVVAFSVAIPLLAALVLVNRLEVFRRRVTRSVLVETARVVAQLCAFTGVVAGFWHILWIAGVGILASGLVAGTLVSADYWRLGRIGSRRLREAKHPATPGHSLFERRLRGSKPPVRCEASPLLRGGLGPAVSAPPQLRSGRSPVRRAVPAATHLLPGGWRTGQRFR